MARGTLYLVATPIGNLEDITLRALRVLKEADLIACEDTRHTAKLLTHFGISTPRDSYHQHNEASRTARLLDLLTEGKSIAVVSDAGMPLVSDPGFVLVSECVRAGIPIVPVPGPSAVLAALSASGLPADSFFFAGFLPPKRSERRRRLVELSGLPCTMVVYEAPHRVTASLADMVETLGPRNACLARELTKVHEEWLRGTLPYILDTLRARDRILGEITIVISRGEPATGVPTQGGPIRGQVEEEMRHEGVSTKEALRTVARKRGISRREAYQMLVREKNPAADE
jgi:16S rRNA (cytidine1402-2'-O)-methyltransferase